MDKRKMDKLIQSAYRAFKEQTVKIGQNVEEKLVVNGKLPKVCRSNIAAFGATIATGSLFAAVSNLINDTYDAKPEGKKANAVNKKSKDKKGYVLCEIMWKLLVEEFKDVRNRNYMKQETDVKCSNLYEYLLDFDIDNDYTLIMAIRANLKDIAIAMKMATNFFELVDETD